MIQRTAQNLPVVTYLKDSKNIQDYISTVTDMSSI